MSNLIKNIVFWLISFTILAALNAQTIYAKPYKYDAANGLNPNDPADAVMDNDNDGVSNLNEYSAGTDPNDIHITYFNIFNQINNNNSIITSMYSRWDSQESLSNVTLASVVSTGNNNSYYNFHLSNDINSLLRLNNSDMFYDKADLYKGKSPAATVAEYQLVATYQDGSSETITSNLEPIINDIASIVDSTQTSDNDNLYFNWQVSHLFSGSSYAQKYYLKFNDGTKKYSFGKSAATNAVISKAFLANNNISLDNLRWRVDIALVDANNNISTRRIGISQLVNANSPATPSLVFTSADIVGNTFYWPFYEDNEWGLIVSEFLAGGVLKDYDYATQLYPTNGTWTIVEGGYIRYETLDEDGYLDAYIKLIEKNNDYLIVQISDDDNFTNEDNHLMFFDATTVITYIQSQGGEIIPAWLGTNLNALISPQGNNVEQVILTHNITSTITWDASQFNSTDSITLYILSADNISTDIDSLIANSTIIVSDIDNNGSYEINPADLGSTGEYIILITNSDNSIWDISNNSFIVFESNTDNVLPITLASDWEYESYNYGSYRYLKDTFSTTQFTGMDYNIINGTNSINNNEGDYILLNGQWLPEDNISTTATLNASGLHIPLFGGYVNLSPEFDLETTTIIDTDSDNDLIVTMPTGAKANAIRFTSTELRAYIWGKQRDYYKSGEVYFSSYAGLIDGFCGTTGNTIYASDEVHYAFAGTQGTNTYTCDNTATDGTIIQRDGNNIIDSDAGTWEITQFQGATLLLINPYNEIPDEDGVLPIFTLFDNGDGAGSVIWQGDRDTKYFDEVWLGYNAIAEQAIVDTIINNSLPFSVDSIKYKTLYGVIQDAQNCPTDNWYVEAIYFNNSTYNLKSCDGSTEFGNYEITPSGSIKITFDNVNVEYIKRISFNSPIGDWIECWVNNEIDDCNANEISYVFVDKNEADAYVDAQNAATILATDTDNDGIPDIYETANGLNPNDPADAVMDNDNDGVSNLDEYSAGTDPNYIRIKAFNIYNKLTSDGTTLTSMYVRWNEQSELDTVSSAVIDDYYSFDLVNDINTALRIDNNNTFIDMADLSKSISKSASIGQHTLTVMYNDGSSETIGTNLPAIISDIPAITATVQSIDADNLYFSWQPSHNNYTAITSPTLVYKFKLLDGDSSTRYVFFPNSNNTLTISKSFLSSNNINTNNLTWRVDIDLIEQNNKISMRRNATPIPIINNFNLDIDGDNIISAATDGILIMRYLLNQSADVIDISGITFADNASRTTTVAILSHLNKNKQVLNIDADDRIEAATDGILILNFMLNPATATLNITDAVGDNANRNDATTIKTYLQTLNLLFSL